MDPVFCPTLKPTKTLASEVVGLIVRVYFCQLVVTLNQFLPRVAYGDMACCTTPSIDRALDAFAQKVTV